MKLYVSLGTNPRVVQLFMAQKGIVLEEVWVDIAKGENRQPDFLRKNPLGQLPVLELESGQCISQITAICEHLEELNPDPPLIGATAQERAETRMWLRRLDLLIVEPLVSAFKYSVGLEYYQPIIHCVPAAVEDLKTIAADNIAWLNGELEGKRFICGNRFTLADIQLYCFLEFGSQCGQPVAPGNVNILSWFDRVKDRLGLAQ